MREAIDLIQHIHGDAMAQWMIIRGSLDADHIIVHSCIVSEKLSAPDLCHSFSCLLGEGVIVAYQFVEAE